MSRSMGDERDDLVDALRALARPDQFFSHTTAARIHCIALPWRLRDDVVHLASPSFTSRMARDGVRGHRITSEVIEIDGIRVETVEGTLIHLGTMLSVDELLLAVEYDGQHHRVDSRQYAIDIERHRRLQELGWMVIRVTEEDLHDGGGRILGVIRAAHASRRDE